MKKTAAILLQSSGIEDWAAFYAELEKEASIPNASDFSNKAGKIIFRDNYLNLQEVKDKVSEINNVVNVILYTDTLEIPEYTKWVINGTSLIIYARNIIVHNHSGILLDFQASQTGKLMVFGREFNGSIEAKCIFNTTDQPNVFYIDAENATPGVMVSASNGKAVLTELTLKTGTDLFPKSDLTYYLNNTFIYGSLLFDQKEEMALSMFLWVKGWASQSADYQALFYRSTSIAALLGAEINAKENGARFVPYLSSVIYVKLSEAFTAAAVQYESDYMILSTQEALTEQNINMAKTMVQNTQAEIEYVNALLKQAKENSDNASAAVNAAMKNFDTQNRIVKMVAIDFETVGIPEYKTKVILQGMFDIITSLATFGVSVGMMAVGNGAGAASAAESVKSVEKVAESGVETAKMAKSLAETMEKLKELIETLEKAIKLAQAIKAIVDNVKEAESQMSKIQELDDYYADVDLSAADDWTIYQIQASNAMKDPISLGIRYAQEYDEAMQILAVYGQSLNAAQLASMKADQELSSIFFQLHYAEEKKKNLEEMVNKLEVGKAATLGVMQEFYQKYLDSKSSLYTALKSYQQSFFYWALAESGIDPKIIDSVDQLDTGLNDQTQMAMDEASALERFDPPPQQMKNMLFVIDDPEILNQLHQEGEAHWILPLEDYEFSGLERVRLDDIRVWIEGVSFIGSERSVFITITNTGNYLDRYAGLDYQFNSKKLTRSFKYKVTDSSSNTEWEFGNGTYGVVQIDGKVDEEVKYAYFRPTPFSEWKISVKSNNTGVDFSGISKITMYFEGSAIPATPSGARRLTLKLQADVSK